MITTLATTVAALALCAQRGVPPTFRLVPLETLGAPNDMPHAIAPDGAVVGVLGNHVGQDTAAHWAGDGAGTLTILGRAGTTDDSGAAAINPSGVVVGWGKDYGSTIPVLWTLADGGRPLDWGGWHGSTTLSAAGVSINAAGDILVQLTAYPAKGGVVVPRTGSPVEIDFPPASFGYLMALADDGRVAGQRYDPSSGFGFAIRWSAATGFVDLAQPAGHTSFGYAISADGDTVVGWSTGQVGNHVHQHAAAWDAAGAITLLPYGSAARITTDNAAALCVQPGATQGPTGAPWIVGWQYGIAVGGDPVTPRSFGTVWVAGTPWILDDIVAGPDQITTAVAVNDAGQIAAQAIVGGVVRAVRLDPLP